MGEQRPDSADIQMIDGEFFTDGKTFVFRLTGTPFSGMGSDPSSAFKDLLRVESEGSDFAQRFRALARDQQSEAVRATIVRYSIIGLITLSVVEGSLLAAAAMLPHVAADVSAAVYSGLTSKIVEMPPDKEEKLVRFLQRIQTSVRANSDSCPQAAHPPASGSQ
jgi:hypothetical protein